MTDTDRYKKIRKALAMGPTPGPWAACRTNSGTFVKSERLAGYFVEVRHCRATQSVDADAHLIAACDPDTIHALLDERDALAAEVERLRALREMEEREQRDEALLRQALEVLSRTRQKVMERAIKTSGLKGVMFAEIFQDMDFVVAALEGRLGEGVET